MGYTMQLEGTTVRMDNPFFSTELLECRTNVEDNSVSMELKDISLGNFHLMHGKHYTGNDCCYSLDFKDSFYASHFVLNNTSSSEKQVSVTNQATIYSPHYQSKEELETGVIEAKKHYEFLELAVRESFIDAIINEDQPYSNVLYQNFYKQEYITMEKRPISFAMLRCIDDLNANLFRGSLQQLYLETKAAELFLLQVQDFKNKDIASTKLRADDVECLYNAKFYIEKNYHTPCTIIDLAKIVGINQTKLKSGFKELFGTTVFGYVKDLQMERARQLLLDEKLYVNEVADQIGYKHAQHFTAAFKRKFGILPSELK